MRKSNWKVKAVVIVALIIGIIAAVIVELIFPEEYAAFRGTCAFFTLAVVELSITYVGIKLFGDK